MFGGRRWSQWFVVAIPTMMLLLCIFRWISLPNYLGIIVIIIELLIGLITFENQL